MAEPVICPKCGIKLTNQSRLVVENCGHSKCRQCLISEENGCQDCKQPLIADQNKTKIHIIEDKYLSTNKKTENAHLSVDSKTRSVAFPAHIVKEHHDDRVVYRCTVCEKRFNSRTQQYYHMFCNNASKKPYKCEQCFKTFSTSSHLKYHMDGHSLTSFSCSICSKTFKKVQILRKHEKLHTAVIQQCTECGIKLKDNVSFIAHMHRHNNIFPYSCSECEKKFSLKSTLRMHQIIHSGIKSFKCNQCDKKFDRSSTLKLHLLRHSKQKKYNCPECYKKFIDNKSLLRHSKIHTATNSKYKCSLCDTTSIRKDNIIRHLKNMHPNNTTTNCIEVLHEERDDSLSNDNSINNIEGAALQQNFQRSNSCTTDVNNTDVPKAVANSSVIRCIGNVQPVIIPQETQIETYTKTNAKETAQVLHPAATAHKKLKKKYDPCEIYRKILLDDDSMQENDTNSIIDNTIPMNGQTKQLPESNVSYSNGQQSNFSETHWRKNFKYTYQIQFD